MTENNYKEVPAHLTPPEREWLKVIAEQIAKKIPATPIAPLFVHIGVMHGCIVAGLEHQGVFL